LYGGQRQRLPLARANAARPSLLLPDDPLSALDLPTEERATQRLREVPKGTTTLSTAHRHSTVAMAPRVATLRHGRLADLRTHHHLLYPSAVYREIMRPAPVTGEDLMDSIPTASDRQPGQEVPR